MDLVRLDGDRIQILCRRCCTSPPIKGNSGSDGRRGRSRSSLKTLQPLRDVADLRCGSGDVQRIRFLVKQPFKKEQIEVTYEVRCRRVDLQLSSVG